MKKLLFIALLMPLSLLAQSSFYAPKSNPPDTQRVIMLVCDTAHIITTQDKYIFDSSGNLTGQFKKTTTDTGYPDNRLTYWIVGYMYPDPDKRIFVKYLDADKKPLKSGIVVWISYTLKH